MACLHILIPIQMWSTVKRLDVGDLVKVQCFLAYSGVECCIYFTAEAVEVISKVKIVVDVL